MSSNLNFAQGCQTFRNLGSRFVWIMEALWLIIGGKLSRPITKLNSE